MVAEDLEVLAPKMRWRTLLCGVLILLCGIVIGGVVTALVTRDHPWIDREGWRSGPQGIADRMQERYGLDDAQKQKVSAVLEEHWKKFSEIRAEVQPRVEAEHEAFRQAMEAVLTPEQAAKWREDFERFRKPWHGGAPPPPSSAAPAPPPSAQP